MVRGSCSPSTPRAGHPEQAAGTEIAAALHVSEFAVARRVMDASELTGAWRPLLDALLAGEVTEAHVRAIGRELRKLPSFGDSQRQDDYVKECRDVLQEVIPHAATHTPRATGDKTQRLVVATDPAGARERRQEVAEQQHGVFLGPGEEPGTCQVTAVMPIAHGQAVVNAVDTLARDERFETADGCVTLGQRKVAALVALIFGEDGTVVIDGPVSEVKIRTHVDVVTPLFTMLALAGGKPADVDTLQGGLVGSQPVTADVLADLLADCDPASTLRRLVTDQNGAVLDLGRSRYAISDAQRYLITRRDRTCRHPGCTRPASRCEVDHATAWNDGGETSIRNLGALCKYHHQAKTHGGWQITKSARDGSCTWRSPLGRIYHHQPPDLLPPTPAASHLR